MMYTKFKRRFFGVVCAALLVGCMTGCSFGEKVTAESLLEGAFPKDIAGMDVDIDMAFACSMDMSELGMSGNMEIAMDMDSNLKTNQSYGYLSGDITVKMLGMSVDQDMESYFDYENGVSYAYDKEADTWFSSDIDKSANTKCKLDAEDFEDLEMVKTDSGYQVTAAMDYDTLEDLMGDGINTTGDLADMGDFSDMKMTAVFDFEKDKSLSSIEVTAEPGEMKDVDLSEFTLKLTVNDMDDDIDVEIPDDVVDNAVPKDKEDGPVSGDLDFSQGDESPDTVLDDEPELDSDNIVSDTLVDDTGVSDNESSSSLIDDRNNMGDLSNTTYGTYGSDSFHAGVKLDTFLSDGWVNKNDDSGIFVSFVNDNYDGANLYLYGNQSEVSMSDLKSGGVSGYTMDVTFCKNNVLPDMQFNGLTWGASRDDIVAAYGTPSNEYKSEDADSVLPYILTYNMGDYTMEFSVANQSSDIGVNGLSRVQLVNYSDMQ